MICSAAVGQGVNIGRIVTPQAAPQGQVVAAMNPLQRVDLNGAKLCHRVKDVLAGWLLAVLAGRIAEALGVERHGAGSAEGDRGGKTGHRNLLGIGRAGSWR